MRRLLFGASAVLSLSTIVLLAAAFTLPTEEIAEPNLDERYYLGHETTFEPFTPVHYPEQGAFVMRHQSWRFSVYLDRSPASGCLLQWVPPEDVTAVTGELRLIARQPRGVFFDASTGIAYGVDGRIAFGSRSRPLIEIAYIKPRNLVHLVERDLRDARSELRVSGVACPDED
ncbi:MAG: hypothetical protein AB7F65_08090 [Dehalococcoidia bacterium]